MEFHRDMLLLYAVTDRSWTGRQSLYDQIQAALEGGVTMVQLREKRLSAQALVEEAVEIKELCHRYHVPLIINDNVEAAVASGADGVHVGITDTPVAEIRKRAGGSFIIGATAKTVAKSVVCSNLIKAAMFGADANWGRVLCAVGYSGASIDVNKIDVSFCSKKGEIAVCKNGAGIDFSEEKAKEILLEHEIEIQVQLNSGSFSSTAWGCDLTYDYVKINGDYRT